MGKPRKQVRKILPGVELIDDVGPPGRPRLPLHNVIVISADADEDPQTRRARLQEVRGKDKVKMRPIPRPPLYDPQGKWPGGLGSLRCPRMWRDMGSFVGDQPEGAREFEMFGIIQSIFWLGERWLKCDPTTLREAVAAYFSRITSSAEARAAWQGLLDLNYLIRSKRVRDPKGLVRYLFRFRPRLKQGRRPAQNPRPLQVCFVWDSIYHVLQHEPNRDRAATYLAADWAEFVAPFVADTPKRAFPHDAYNAHKQETPRRLATALTEEVFSFEDANSVRRALRLAAGRAKSPEGLDVELNIWK